MSVRQVYLVGHCGADGFALHQAVKASAGERDDLNIRTAVDTDPNVQNAGPDTLLLINRQLGNVLSKRLGVELIQTLNQRDAPPRMMLISNYDDAQQQAIEAGALPGFGKSQLHRPETKAKLEAALAD